VSEEAPGRIAVIWPPEARADLRAIDRDAAIHILHCIDGCLSSRTGDVKRLKPPESGFRLRWGHLARIALRNAIREVILEAETGRIEIEFQPGGVTARLASEVLGKVIGGRPQ
jgi:nucleotide-binding universal stress UspA family protein